MEGAVRSGYLAAEAVLADSGVHRSCSCRICLPKAFPIGLKVSQD